MSDQEMALERLRCELAGAVHRNEGLVDALKEIAKIGREDFGRSAAARMAEIANGALAEVGA